MDDVFSFIRTGFDFLLFFAAFFIGYFFPRMRKVPKLPSLAIGDVISIDGKYFRLQSYEHASGGVMDSSTVYTFIDMTLQELDERGLRRPKGWRKGKNGRLY